ncbi:MAG: hypothetical protein HN891_10125 [Planctomycetes bacterium]|jgi:hypothetical protein|nr:hypothetical protein [Planctomycetota bacterium]MBT6452821.1 hypothetical protein [Planctomycetota bacterium]MBT6541645.1 hypothetical protein [Planctomycetota bacterium]MBT6785560.1 hypothetical protein [Planctomycetota bacterium]MBT6967564.1 hypothetical protein [Planctomycetota bacterium]
MPSFPLHVIDGSHIHGPGQIDTDPRKPGLFMQRRVHPREVGYSKSHRGWTDGLLSVLVTLFIFASTAGPLEAQSTNKGYSGALIELGDAIIFPGDDFALLPIRITSDQPIVAWQMGLEYDELLLSFDAVIFTGTESENLQTTTVTSPSTPPFNGLQVLYGGNDTLPAGTGVLAAFLRMSIVNPDLIPDRGSISTSVAAVSTELHPLTLTGQNGSNVIPSTVPGTVTAFDFPLFLIESHVGTAIDESLSIPIRAWTEGPASNFAMGLEYDELIVCELTIQGGDFDDMTQGQWNLVEQISTNSDNFVLSTTAGPVPALTGETLGYLVIARPPSAPGAWELDLIAGQSFVDNNPVGNLIGGMSSWINHFLRGDANLDAAIDLADAEKILNASTIGAPLPCRDAADVNDDGVIDVSDVVTILQFLFSGSPPPPAPFPDPGEDTTLDFLDCL